MDFEPVTSEDAVNAYKSSSAIFNGLIEELRRLSKKKPEASMSASKVKLINRVLDDLIAILKEEPEGKYLDRLDSDTLPQVSDAVLMMVQFETALEKFRNKYYRKLEGTGNYYWITKEFVAEVEADNPNDDDSDEDGSDR